MSHVYEQLAPRGWILTDKCDSLLFSCLQAVALEEQFDIDAAFFNGLWHRRPAKYGKCSSTISRDMFLGLFAYCLHFGRLDILDKLWKSAWSRGWKMGIETKKWNNRVYMTPTMMVLLYQLRRYLRTGSINWVLDQIPVPRATSPGYVSHLSMLQIYLNLRMRGKLVTHERSQLTKMLKHSSQNPLIHALLGNKLNALVLLDKYWPKDRLPTTREWSEEWRTQRHDQDTGLLPAPGKKHTHTGGDLLFVRHVLSLHQ